MICPHCRKTLADAPDLAGQMVKCPECGKTFGMSAAPSPAGRPTVRAVKPPPPPPATPAAPAFAPAEEPVIRSRGIFRPREYPALRIIIIVLYVLAALIFADFVLGELFLFGGTFAGLASVPSRQNEDARSAVSLLFFFTQTILIISHATAITIVVGSAECVRVFLDIQHNTQEAAFHSKRIP